MGNSRQELNTEDDLNRIVKWNWGTIFMLVIAFVFVIVSIFAPLIFTSDASSKRYNFTTTGQIGDTIGGLMNPFISIAGVLMTFLAFYLQFKSNQLQFRLYFESRRNDEILKSNEEHKLYRDLLDLFYFDLISIIKDSETRSKLMKEYFDNVLENPVKFTPLIRTVGTFSYKAIRSENRLQLFNSFKSLFPEETQMEDFRKLDNILSFMEPFYNDIYQKVDNHFKSQSKQKNLIRDKIRESIDLASQILQEKNKEEELLDILDKLIRDYYQVVNEAQNVNGDNRTETDLLRISEFVFKGFLELTIKYNRTRKGQDFYYLDMLVNNISNLRKDIFLVKQDSLKNAQLVKESYSQLKGGGEGNTLEEPIIQSLELLSNRIKLLTSEKK